MTLLQHWYLVTVAILSVLLVGGLIAGFFVPARRSVSLPPPKTNCQVNPGFITNIAIGSSDKEDPSGYYCPVSKESPYTPVHSDVPLNRFSLPYLQVCQSSASTICDQTPVVVDVKLRDMTAINGIYKEPIERCCNPGVDCDYFPPLSFNRQNPSLEDKGEMPRYEAPGQRKMGLCVQTRSIGDLKQSRGRYIPSQDGLYFVSKPKNTPASQICPSGYETDGINRYKGTSETEGLFLCKKYATV